MSTATPVRASRRRAGTAAVLSAALLLLGGTASAGVAGRSAPASVVTADVTASLSITSLPSTVTPPLSSATTDTAYVQTPTLSRCNVIGGTINPKQCIFGDRSGSHTMVLWGDSHAFMWFPAVNAIAKADHWRLYAMMEFGCPVADISVWNLISHTVYGTCDAFRKKVISIINGLRPNLVIMTEEFTSYAAAGRGTPNTISTTQWTAALEKTLHLIHARKMRKVVLGSTVATGGLSPDGCLAANPSAVQTCTIRDTPDQLAQRAAEATAAASASAHFVDVMPWLCSASVTPLACSPVIGDATDGYMIVYYAVGHLSETYDLFLSGVLGSALRPYMH